MRFLLLAILTMVYSISLADDSALNNGNNGAVPLDLKEGIESPVSMDKEVLVFKFGFDQTNVAASFYLRNTTEKPVTQWTGFPDEALGASKDAARDPAAGIFPMAPLNNMKTFVNGKMIKSKIRYGRVKYGTDENVLMAWYVCKLSFAGIGKTLLERRYWAHNGGHSDSVSLRKFVYFVKTGSSWKGPIGNLTLDLYLEDGITVKDLAWEDEYPEGDRYSTEEKMYPPKDSWQIISENHLRLVWNNFEPRDESDNDKQFITVATRNLSRVESFRKLYPERIHEQPIFFGHRDNGGKVTNMAGSGSLGSVNGTATNASFNGPTGVAVDSSGHIYVADSINHLIRKIAPDRRVTTLAGKDGMAGSENGSGTEASFNSPMGIAVDQLGYIYVADTGNNLIRKITSEGLVTNLAGSGSVGSVNGTGVAASFNHPRGIAVDSMGHVYVADSGNNLIREITPEGLVTTLAGTGYPGSANGTVRTTEFNSPQGVAVDYEGIVYVADTNNHLIKRFTAHPDSMVSTLAGSGILGHADGIRDAASFDDITGIAVDANLNIYVTDSRNHIIREINPGGKVMTLAGAGVAGIKNGTGTKAMFNKPTGVAVSSFGVVYVADSGNNIIREIK